MNKTSHKQHAAYLNPLLEKHRAKEGITFEDLQNAWKTLEKLCNSANFKPLEEIYLLHQSLLEKYNAAAKDYYQSFLSQYRPPSPSPTQTQTVSAAEYTNKAINAVQIQEWKVSPKHKNEWLHDPLKAVLLKTYKKDELKRKMEGLKLKQSRISSISTSSASTSISVSAPVSAPAAAPAPAPVPAAGHPVSAPISTIRKQVEKETLKEETNTLKEEMKNEASEVIVIDEAGGDGDGDSPSNEQEPEGDQDNTTSTESEEDEDEIDLTKSDDNEHENQDEGEGDDGDIQEVHVRVSPQEPKKTPVKNLKRSSSATMTSPHANTATNGESTAKRTRHITISNANTKASHTNGQTQNQNQQTGQKRKNTLSAAGPKRKKIGGRGSRGRGGRGRGNRTRGK